MEKLCVHQLSNDARSSCQVVEGLLKSLRALRASGLTEINAS